MSRGCRGAERLEGWCSALALSSEGPYVPEGPHLSPAANGDQTRALQASGGLLCVHASFLVSVMSDSLRPHGL